MQRRSARIRATHPPAHALLPPWARPCCNNNATRSPLSKHCNAALGEFFWITQKQIFMMVSFERSDDPAATAAPGGIASLLRDLQPDNTTVFTKKGDVLRLGELVRRTAACARA